MKAKWILVMVVLFCAGCVIPQNGAEDAPPYVLNEQWGERIESAVDAVDQAAAIVKDVGVPAAASVTMYYPPAAGVVGLFVGLLAMWKKLKPDIEMLTKKYTAHKRGAETFMRSQANKDVSLELYEDIGAARRDQDI